MKSTDFTSWASEASILSVQTAPSKAAAQFMRTFTAPKNYKDATKIREYIESQKATFYEKAALDAMRAEIVVVGLHDVLTDDVGFFCLHTTADLDHHDLLLGGDHRVSLFTSEADLLQAVLSGLPKRLVGQALNSFHLPMLIRRCLYHGFEVPARFLPKPRYFDSYNCFDFCEAWSLGKTEDKYVSLENLALFFLPGHEPNELPLSVTDTTTLVNRFRKDPAATLADFALSLDFIQEIAPMLYIVRNHPIPDLK
ncbi:hypothetical protein LCGC14_2105770 [marine sediment metagenome]|uniref:Uncharacterized protein n=1 Tax=marine sediment metagenome TaxID=412755 RepID=A0A0F9EVW1_9ZZZZ